MPPPPPAPKQSASGLTVFAAPLSADDADDEISEVNSLNLASDALRAAQQNAILQLPSGTIYLGRSNGAVPLLLDQRHSGLTIQGNGPAATLLVNRVNYLPVLRLTSTRIPYFSEGTFTAGDAFLVVTSGQGLASYHDFDVLYFWPWNTGQVRSERQRLTVTEVVGTQVNLNDEISATLDPTNFKHIENGIAVSNAAPAGTTVLNLEHPEQLGLLQVDDDVFITDGPACNEIFGEWSKVKAIDDESSPPTVTLHRPLVRSYEEGYVCIVPPPHMTDITIRDLSIAVSKYEGALAFGYVDLGVRIRFENVDFVQGPPEGATPGVFQFANVSDLRLQNCNSIGNFGFNVCQLVFADGIRAVRGLGGEEYCTEMFFSHLNVGGFKFSFNSVYGGAHGCTRIFLTDSVINGAVNGTLSLPDESAFVNVQILNYHMENDTIPVYLNADNSSLINVRSDRWIQFIGQGWRVAMLNAPAAYLINYPYPPYTPGTGIFLTPLMPDPTQVNDATDPGNWRIAFLAFTDGNIATSQFQSTTGSPTTIVGKLPIHDDEDGSLIGYIPVYEDFT